MTMVRTLNCAFDTTLQNIQASLGEVVIFLEQHVARDVIELTLAEALTNIVEHAFDGPGYGELAISELGDGTVHCVLRDRGRAYTPPDPIMDGPARESGYGWGLIRGLCKSVGYERAGDLNILALEF